MVWTRQKRISLALNSLQLKKEFPASICTIKRSKLTWVGDLQPTALSLTYKVRIEYQIDGNPSVDLVHPKLERRDGKLPRHLYPQERLCLYLPGGYEWNAQMLLVETIVPWTAEWLMHYEIWLATGEWCGGGMHPSDGEKLDRRRHSTDPESTTRRRNSPLSK